MRVGIDFLRVELGDVVIFTELGNTRQAWGVPLVEAGRKAFGSGTE